MNTLCVGMKVLVLSTLMIAVTSANYTEMSTIEFNSTNTSNYWVEDHPYNHQPNWKRLPDGKVVPNNESRLDDYRGAVEAKTPWISKWVLSTEGRRTLKKDIPRLLMYNLVSPMDYGSSVRSGNVRRRRNKAIGMYLTDNLALPLLKSLGHVAWDLIQTHYVDYFEEEMFAKRLELMNASEMIQEFNLSMPSDEEKPEESKTNTTQPFVCRGKRNVLYERYSVAFTPYKDYSDQYYTLDDNLPPPTFPADSYPWIWSPRLGLARTIASQLFQFFSDNSTNLSAQDDRVELGSCSSSCVESKSQRNLGDQGDGSSFIVNTVMKSANNTIPAQEPNESVPSSTISMNATDVQALEQIQAQLQEFFLDSGIPRFTNRSNGSHPVFPTLTEFFQATAATNTSASHSTQTFTASLWRNTNENDTSSATDFSSRSGVYTALSHFYAYPSIEEVSKRLMQSGVTVYTPSLITMPVFQTLADANVDPATKRSVRLEALQNMVKIAFEAEERALRHGLQAPSTAWYSTHDLDVDEFADAVLGTVNISISGESGDRKPLHVFEKHMNERVPILDDVVSYYADTNHDTKVSMERNRIPKLDKFEESELGELIRLTESQMSNLDRSITRYVQTRAVSPFYQEVVNATSQGEFYNGSEYTLIGFGFVIPATNEQNVLYRDMKLPVPFHLVLRLIVRFQESRLLLPEESRQLLICLTMAFYNIPFYRCHP
ncbi:hypothetical protein P3T76_005302 [Phytophthora citrophthora]|uniref:RxLR effector protein n=1 Tax=Phytophthora citrophthora TaxID=4793 RepID=A0AAD9GTK5_9STRA|nr:hypothetical protein P3T76_005302 [Phytophthora citrophthora]